MVDLDECAFGNATCDQNCTNTMGSYNCSCFDGYEYNVATLTCEGIN